MGATGIAFFTSQNFKHPRFDTEAALQGSRRLVACAAEQSAIAAKPPDGRRFAGLVTGY